MRKTGPCGSNVTTSPKVGLGQHPGSESQRALAECGGGDTYMLCPQSSHECRRRSWLPAPGHERLKQSWARGVGSSGGWRRSSLSAKRVSGSSGTSGALCRRTTTGKVSAIGALGPQDWVTWLALDPCVTSAGCSTQ